MSRFYLKPRSKSFAADRKSAGWFEQSLKGHLFVRATRRMLVVAAILVMTVAPISPPPVVHAQAGGSGASVTISSSTATGVVLGAAAQYQVMHNHQWDDYENVMVLATLDGAAKMAANTGKPMTTTDYLNVANQVRKWLDQRAPQNQTVLNHDQADQLRYATDALFSVVNYAPGGSIVTSVLGGLEKLKINQLERTIDPSRQDAADLEFYNLAKQGKQYAADRVQEGTDLAQNDPQFAAAFNTVVHGWLGVDTTSSSADVEAVYPNAVPSLPSPNSDGSITVNPSDLESQAQAIVDKVRSGTEADISDLQSVSNYQLNNFFPADPTTSPSPVPPGNTDNPDQRQAQRELVLDAAQSSITALSKLIGLSDPHLAQQVASVGSATIQVGESVSKYLHTVETATSAFAEGLAGVALTGNIIGAAVDIFSAVFGGGDAGGPSPDEVILQQIQVLSQQIEELHQDMNNRFDRVDASLNTILMTLNQNFSQIDYQLGVLNGDAHTIQAGLLDLQGQLNRMEQYSFAWLTALSKEQFIQTLNGCLGYRARTGADVGFAQYASCENAFYSWAHDSALDELWAGVQQADYSDVNIYPTLLNFPLSVNLNYLAQFPNQRLQLPALTNARLANPNEWTLGVRAYLQLAKEWPQYAVQISSSRMDDLIQIGTTLRQAVQDTNSINNGGAITANQALFAALVNKYNVAVGNLQSVIQGVVDNYIHDPANKLQEGPGGPYLNLWGGTAQTTSYPPAALSASSLPACNDASRTYTVPSNLITLISPVAAVAEQLGVGNLTLCLNYSSTAAFPSTPAPPPFTGQVSFTLDTYAINGTLSGSLAFSQRMYVLDLSGYDTSTGYQGPCGPDQVWNRLVPPCDGSGSLLASSVSLIARVPPGPVGSPLAAPCWSLASEYNTPNALQPSPPFQQLINAGYYQCRLVPGPLSLPALNIGSLQSIFVTSSDPVDTTAALDSLRLSVRNVLESAQQSLYGQISSAFLGATSLQVAGQSLTGPKLLLQSYLNLGLPISLAANDYLRSLLYGDHSILDGSNVQADFAAFSTSNISDATHNKIADEIATINSRSAALSYSLAGTLNQIQQTPESLDQIDITLEDLQAFETLKNAGAISPCDYRLSSTFASVGPAGGNGTITVTELDGCPWIASTGASWLKITSSPSGTGNGSVAYSVAANIVSSPRSAIFIIGDQIFHVLQAGSTTAGNGSGGGTGGGSGGGSTGGGTSGGSGTPAASLFPNSLNFGGQNVGSSSSAKTITLSNSGTAPLILQDTQITGDYSESNNCGGTVAPGANCSIQVTFVPTAPGPLAGTLTIMDNAADSPQTVAVSGTGQDFTFGAVPKAPMTVNAGQTATYNLTVTAVGGFNQNVSLSCAWASAQPNGTSCAVKPTSLTPVPSGSPVTVTVSTTARSVTSPHLRLTPLADSRHGVAPWQFWLPVLLALASLACLRRHRGLVGLASTMLFLLMWTACGGGSSVGPPPQNGNGGTPGGSYNLIVTATSTSGSVFMKHDVTLTLKIN